MVYRSTFNLRLGIWTVIDENRRIVHKSGNMPEISKENAEHWARRFNESAEMARLEIELMEGA